MYISLILLILLGIILMILDFLVIPGGIVAIIGVICVAGSVVTSFVKFGSVIGTLTLIGTAIAIFLSLFLMMRTKTWRKLQLKTKIDSKMNEIDHNKIYEGAVGIAISRLAPSGNALFGDTEAEVTSLDGFVDEKSEIVIHKIDGNKITVKLK